MTNIVIKKKSAVLEEKRIGDIAPYTFFSGKFGGEHGLFFRGYNVMICLTFSKTWDTDKIINHLIIDYLEHPEVTITLNN